MKRCFSLQKYAGISSRHTCPSCGGKRCFTLYVDEAGEPLAENVGRCDHESSCGYHYSPKDYFRDHPEADGKDWRETEPEWLKKALERRKQQERKPLCYLPAELVMKSVRPDIVSSFTLFLLRLFDDQTVVRLVNDYRLGVTKAGDVIFFQIDKDGNCRTGKIMKYDPETGHRIKDEQTKGRITWAHSLLKYANALPRDWQLTQCLFGEHLLAEHPDKPVALVESEKTAVICAAMMPEYIWLATGGKSQFNERLNVLQGRDIVAFPDVDGFDTWTEKAALLPYLNIKVSNLLQKNATEEERAKHIDIADWLVKWNLEPRPAASTRLNRTFQKVAKYFSPEYHTEILALIEEFELEVWW
jgi:hypothetical protein